MTAQALFYTCSLLKWKLPTRLHICGTNTQLYQLYDTKIKAVGVFIAKDLQPFSVTGDVGFCHLINALVPHYKLPSHFSSQHQGNFWPLWKDTQKYQTNWLKHRALLWLQIVVPHRQQRVTSLWLFTTCWIGKWKDPIPSHVWKSYKHLFDKSWQMQWMCGSWGGHTRYTQ